MEDKIKAIFQDNAIDKDLLDQCMNFFNEVKTFTTPNLVDKDIEVQDDEQDEDIQIKTIKTLRLEETQNIRVGNSRALSLFSPTQKISLLLFSKSTDDYNQNKIKQAFGLSDYFDFIDCPLKYQLNKKENKIKEIPLIGSINIKKEDKNQDFYSIEYSTDLGSIIITDKVNLKTLKTFPGLEDFDEKNLKPRVPHELDNLFFELPKQSLKIDLDFYKTLFDQSSKTKLDDTPVDNMTLFLDNRAKAIKLYIAQLALEDLQERIETQISQYKKQFSQDVVNAMEVIDPRDTKTICYLMNSNNEEITKKRAQAVLSNPIILSNIINSLNQAKAFRNLGTEQYLNDSFFALVKDKDSGEYNNYGEFVKENKKRQILENIDKGLEIKDLIKSFYNLTNQELSLLKDVNFKTINDKNPENSVSIRSLENFLHENNTIPEIHLSNYDRENKAEHVIKLSQIKSNHKNHISFHGVFKKIMESRKKSPIEENSQLCLEIKDTYLSLWKTLGTAYIANNKMPEIQKVIILDQLNTRDDSRLSKFLSQMTNSTLIEGSKFWHERSIEFSKAKSNRPEDTWNVKLTPELRNAIENPIQPNWLPLTQEIKIGEYTLTPITSDESLKKESEILDHCVGRGGYMELCLYEKHHIYSLSKNGEKHSTLEVKLNFNTNDQTYKIESLQHKSYQNQDPDINAHKATEEFINKVNEGDYKVDIKSLEKQYSENNEKKNIPSKLLKVNDLYINNISAVERTFKVYQQIMSKADQNLSLNEFGKKYELGIDLVDIEKRNKVEVLR